MKKLFLFLIVIMVLGYPYCSFAEQDAQASAEARGMESLKELMFYKKLDESKARNMTKRSSKEAMFYEKLKDGRVQCKLCFRKCLIAEGKRGFCRVRENRAGRLHSLVYGLPSAVQIDPIEKEPCFHMLPATKILCFGTAGCNFRCRHCHNWHLSQSRPEELRVFSFSPSEAVGLALWYGTPTISFTYNDPIVFYEYMYEVAKAAKEKGLKILWHTNGSLSPDALRHVLKYTDAVIVDLKGFTKEAYDNSDARLQPVLDNLKIIKEEGVWVELVNLVIPTVNDSPEDIRRMCKWIKEELSPDVPLHFSRFSPSYKLVQLPSTPIKTLETAYAIAKEEGLDFVTLGNVPGHKNNSTFCPKCGKVLIKRVHFQVLANNIQEGKCKFCKKDIPGVWD